MRKTNLFYLDGNDSKFLTFSNYSEYLTGVYLSTNHKIYLSSFLCLNLPFSDSKKVKDLKKYLTQHYENKLAVLKDNVEQNNELFEDQVYPLAYLLETITTYFKEIPKIVYYGDVTEHDYNGTYADSICLVDLDKFYHGIIESEYPSEKISIAEFEDNTDILLHGWKDGELVSPYNYVASFSTLTDIDDNSSNNVTEELNDENNDNSSTESTTTTSTESPTEEPIKESYNIKTKLTSINIQKNEKDNELQFNCVIPLFDVIDVNIQKYNNTTNEYSNESNENVILLDSSSANYNKYENIPYGIWFSGNDPESDELTTTTTDESITTTTTEEPDFYINPIILHKDTNNISQSWSLVIASKFSPYPFGINAQTEFVDDKETRLEKYTYAELLERHSKLLDVYNNLISKYSNIEEKINELSNKINKEIGQTDIDKLTIKFENFKQEIKNDLNNKINEIDEKLSILKWKNINKVESNE